MGQMVAGIVITGSGPGSLWTRSRQQRQPVPDSDAPA